MKWFYLLLAVIGYFFILLYPEIEEAVIISSIRKVVWQTHWISFTLFHLIIGFILSFIIATKPRALCILLVSLVPILGFSAFFLYYAWLENVYKGTDYSEGMVLASYLMLYSISVTICGALIASISEWKYSQKKQMVAIS